jgi:hypothetical protein
MREAEEIGSDQAVPMNDRPTGRPPTSPMGTVSCGIACDGASSV